jgi:hypothetical protein
MSISQQEFEGALTKFDKVETMRGRLYCNALGLISRGFRVEAHMLILATWNFARFRYALRDFNLPAFEHVLSRLRRSLQPLASYDLMSIDLAKHQDTIVSSFDTLAAIKGIEYTGATKVLHLLNSRVFVMWDRFISGQYPKRYYEGLGIVRSGFWPYRKFQSSGRGYLDFLTACQERFRGLRSPDKRKTLAKCIDEFNFGTISEPIEKAKRKERKKRKRSGAKGLSQRRRFQ